MKIRQVITAVLLCFLMVGCSGQSSAQKTQEKKEFSADDLAHAKISLYAGTTYHDKILQEYPDAELYFMSTIADMMLYCKQGKADCFVCTEAEFLNAKREDPSFNYFTADFADVDIVGMFNPQRKDVWQQFEEFLAEGKKNGLIDELTDKWITGPEEGQYIDIEFTGENGVLKFATEALHPPFTFIKDGKVVGYDVDIACRFAQAYGYKLEISNVSWDAMNMGVLSGRYDLGFANIFYSEERAEESLFSDSYYHDEVIVAYPDEDYFDLSQLNGKKISLIAGSIFDKPAQQVLTDPEILYFPSGADCLNALLTGKVDASINEIFDIEYLESHNMGVKLVSPVVVPEICAFPFRTGMEDLVEQFNVVIKRMHEDGTIDSLIEKWILSDDNTKTIEQDWPAENGILEFWIVDSVPPTAFTQSEGVFGGIDVDVALYVARELGYGLNITPVDFAALLAGLASGKADFGGGAVGVTEERKQSFTFTDSIYEGGGAFFVADKAEEKESFFKSISNSFTRTFITESRWKMFLSGTLNTILISVVAVLAGTVLGFGLYMICRNGNKILNSLFSGYQWLINGIPVVVLLMVLYYVIFGNSSLSGIWISAIGFILIFASAMAGMLQSGVSAVDKGQEEAGLALGYTPLQTFFKIILPQAARIFMPSYVNEVVQIIKATAVVGYIAVQDVTKVSDLVRSRTYEPFFPLIATAVIYFVVAWFMTIAFKWIIKKISPTDDRTKRALFLKGVNR